MVSSNAFSSIERSPRAPVFRFIAFFATASRASCRISSSTFSSSNSLPNCLISAFLGSVRMVIKASSSSSSSVAIIGMRPTNSGISPYLIKSSGSRSGRNSLIRASFEMLLMSAPKPIPDFSERCWMTFSSPENAPPQINNTFRVSTCRNSCCGCLRPPCGGTEATVPSISLSSAC